MTRTDYIRWPTGATLYAKPLPLTDSAWGDDDIAGVENAALGSYAFAALAETTEYEVFVQAGGSPASSDLAIGKLATQDANVTKWLGVACATPNQIGVPVVDVVRWLGEDVVMTAFAGVPEVNVKYVSSDSTAADNLEKAFDGTGYSFPNSTIAGLFTTADIAESVWTTDLLSWGPVMPDDTGRWYLYNALGMQATTIATLTSQTSFTLLTGSGDDDAYNGGIAVIEASAGTRKAVGVVSDYDGTTKTVTLVADPGIFTMAVGDTVHIKPYVGESDWDEPGQDAPPATASRGEKLDYIYKAWRNKKTQTATQISVFNDDGVTVDHKATISDDGTTATVGEMETGP